MDEFYPADRWKDSKIPKPNLIRKVKCHVYGHKWETNHWLGQGEPNWPQYEYCTNCWLHRKKTTDHDLGELIINHDCSKR